MDYMPKLVYKGGMGHILVGVMGRGGMVGVHLLNTCLDIWAKCTKLDRRVWRLC